MVISLDSLTCCVDGLGSLRTLWVFSSILILWTAYWFPGCVFQFTATFSPSQSCDHITTASRLQRPPIAHNSAPLHSGPVCVTLSIDVKLDQQPSLRSMEWSRCKYPLMWWGLRKTEIIWSWQGDLMFKSNWHTFYTCEF